MNALEVREAFLAEMADEMRGRLSPLEAHFTIEEMRQHLTELARAYEELGEDPEAAMSAAVSRFGKATHIALGLGPNRSARNDRRVALGIAILINLWVGAAIMVGLDCLLAGLRVVSQTEPSVDFGIGAAAGLVACLLAFYLRLRTVYCAAIMVLAANMIIIPLNAVSLQLIGWEQIIIIGGLLVVAALIGASGSLLVSELQRRIPSRPSQRAMTERSQ